MAISESKPVASFELELFAVRYDIARKLPSGRCLLQREFGSTRNKRRRLNAGERSNWNSIIRKSASATSTITFAKPLA
jgi:hypothetical protein